MPLSEVFTSIKSGFAYGKDSPTGILQIRMNNITPEGTWDLSKQRRVPQDHKAIAKSDLTTGDILFNVTNTPNLVGKTALFKDFPETATFSNHFLRLRTNDRIANSSYVARWMQFLFSIRAFEGMCRQWVNQATINTDTFLSTEIPLPPMKEQRKIVSLLDQIAALREQRRKTLSLLDNLEQSTFLQMFGEAILGRGNWPMVTIGDLIESTQYGSSEKAANHGILPILRMGNITSSGQVSLHDMKYLPDAPGDDRFLVKNGELLFNRTNSPDLVGKTAIYRGPEPMAYAGYLIRVRTGSKSDPAYLNGFLNSKFGKLTLRNMCKSIVGMANINAKELRGIKVPKPPLELQREFTRQVQQISRLRDIQESHLAELDSLFSSVQARAFRGELWETVSG